jgi:hypothetical protein
MPDPVTALVVGGTSLVSSAVGSKAAKSAGQLQYDASQAGVAETRAAREEMRALLEPYVAAGGPALQAQMGALGLAGPEAQQAYVAQQEQSPAFQALARQQEEAILQNASATGGLRGGNVQGALAQFRPALLNQFLEQQYGRLGGMTSLGQQSAAGVGTAGMQSATSISNLLAEGGAARAGAKLGSANAWQQSLSLPAQFAGMAIGRGY